MHHDYIPSYRVSTLMQRHPCFEESARIRIREGWLPLIESFLSELRERFPQIRILNLTASTWLSIYYDGEDVLATPRRVELQRFVQGIVTQSLHTCEHCGGYSSVREWRPTGCQSRHQQIELGRTLCEECVPAMQHAAWRCNEKECA